MALGSQDSKVTVWLSNAQRPLVVASRMFKQSVVDLAWTPDGYTLLACSTDGTIGVLQFEPHELGAAMSQARRARAHAPAGRDRRGSRLTRARAAGRRRGSPARAVRRRAQAQRPARGERGAAAARSGRLRCRRRRRRTACGSKLGASGG